MRLTLRSIASRISALIAREPRYEVRGRFCCRSLRQVTRPHEPPESKVPPTNGVHVRPFLIGTHPIRAAHASSDLRETGHRTIPYAYQPDSSEVSQHWATSNTLAHENGPLREEIIHHPASTFSPTRVSYPRAQHVDLLQADSRREERSRPFSDEARRSLMKGPRKPTQTHNQQHTAYKVASFF